MLQILCCRKRKNMETSTQVTDEDLESAYKIMAMIVRKYGDKYLPVFKRIHEERELRKAQQSLKNIALQIAQDV